MGHHRLPGNHRGNVADLRALVRHDRSQTGLARRVGSLYSRLGRLWRGDLAPASDSRSRLSGPRRLAPVLNQRRDYHRHLFGRTARLCLGLQRRGNSAGFQRWSGAGRVNHRALELALDILHQPSAWHLWLAGSQRLLRNIMGAQRQHFDPFGAALLAAGFALLTLALSFAPEWGWSSWRFLVCFGVSMVGLLAVPAVERRVRDPIIDLRLLQNRVFTSALLSMTLAMLALFAVGFMLPFYFEELRGFSVAKSGLFLAALPLSLALVAPVSGSLADRFGSRWLAPGGLALACVGLVLVARLNA